MTLPPEIIKMILDHLNYHQRRSISRTSRIWRFLFLSTLNKKLSKMHLIKFRHTGYCCCIDANQHKIFVTTNHENNYIYEMNQDDEVVNIFRIPFIHRNDVDIFIKPDGDILIFNLSCIYLCDNKFEIHKKYDLNCQQDDEFKIAIDYQNNNIIIANHTRCIIEIFNENMEFISRFGMEGQQNGQFVHPNHVLVNQLNQNIIITDATNRIQIFDRNGDFLSLFLIEDNITPNHIKLFQDTFYIILDVQDVFHIYDKHGRKILMYDLFDTHYKKYLNNFAILENENIACTSPDGIYIMELI